MYLMDYDSVKMTNYVQRFCIIPRVRLLTHQHRTGVRGVGNSVVGTLPCHASIWQKSCDFGLYRPQPTIPDCL